MQDTIIASLGGKSGHFRLESGHHGTLWIELERLFLRPERLAPLVAGLTDLLTDIPIDAVCGPLNEGAFVALMVASRLGVAFSYAERIAHPEREGLFPVEYRIPRAPCSDLRGKRVAVVNDVISAGSAVRGAWADLERCGAIPVAIATLLVLGESAALFARQKGIPLLTLASRSYDLWEPERCPLCARGEPLEDRSG